ncbi:hypothetical protein L1765_09745 [Microaerobacter geothermalis]|uniref:hypothetical protein n=1 Tax=Microaerobacter geothermalis TaxID=674972 RepID=UPI001F457C85|nr:hypothetical protein [Microaerobacter geothermalis]MCF6094246.1 hypothetical protein [Microaerobacter geothermalis]
MPFYVEIDEDNHVPLGNGNVLVWMRHDLKNRAMDWLKQIYYPDYDLSSYLLSEDGVQIFIKDKGEKVCYDPLGLIQDHSGQLGEPISIEDTRFLPDSGIYQVTSRKGNTVVQSETWVPVDKSGVVKEFRIRTVKGNGTEVIVYPSIHLINVVNRYEHIYVSRKEENCWLAVTVPDAIYSNSGDREKVIRGTNFAVAEHGSRPLHVTWKVERTVKEGEWSDPCEVVIAMGSSEQDAVQQLNLLVNERITEKERVRCDWETWLENGVQITGKDPKWQYYWNTSLRLLRTSIQQDGSPIMVGFAPYQGNVWVRDGVWIIDTLLKTGHIKEAVQGLRRICSLLKKRPDGNYFFAYNCKSGVPNEHSFENDSPGLLLMSIARCVLESGYPQLLNELEDVIFHCVTWIEKNRDDTGMIAPCAGIWETFGHHLNEENEHMVWASGVAVYGLTLLADVWKIHSLGIEYEGKLRKLAADLKESILQQACKDHVLVRSAETDHLDASALLFFTELPIFDDKLLFSSTVKAVEERLVDPFLGGVWRHEDLTTECGDMRPWLGCTFWLIQAYHLLGEWDKACQLLKRAMNYSTRCGLFPELMYSCNKPRGIGMPSYSQSGFIRTMLQFAGDPENPLVIKFKGK